MSDFIHLNQENGIARIQLNRPASYNSFNRQMALELQHILATCAGNPEIRVVCISGQGKAFCAGQDLVEVSTPELHPGFKAILDEHYAPIIRAITHMEKPVVAAVNGVAAGAGANIALACDIVLAKESALFIQAFSGIGLIPDSGGTWILPRLVGLQKAMALTMLGDRIPAREAESMGMIYKALPDEEFEEKTSQILEKLAGMPTYGLALTKKALYLGLQQGLEEQLKTETQLQILASESEDYHEGVEAFLQKRKPNFKGK
jgi:2-(1,2-epoxy-1,2-dihydrophenyl)acetyl-CoA isomerase